MHMIASRSLSVIAAAATVFAGVVGAAPAFAEWGAVPSTSSASVLSMTSPFGPLITPPVMPQVPAFGPYPY
jgi:hypothetical protein